MDKWDKILMGIVSALFVALGIAICLTGGLGLVIGGALLSGGVSGFAAIFGGVKDWSTFWKCVGGGILTGLISGFCAPFVSAAAGAFASLTSITVAKCLIYLVVSVVGHMGISFVTNGVQNLIMGRKFMDNYKQALVAGALIGAVSAAMHGLQSYGVQKAMDRVKRFCEEYGIMDKVKDLRTHTQGFLSGILDRLPSSMDWLKNVGSKIIEKVSTEAIKTAIEKSQTFLLHFALNTGVSMGTQYIMTGKVNLVQALITGAAYGYVNDSIASSHMTDTGHVCNHGQPFFCQPLSQVAGTNLIYNPNTSNDSTSQTTSQTTGEPSSQPGNTNAEPINTGPENSEQVPEKEPLPPTYEEATRDTSANSEESIPRPQPNVTPAGNESSSQSTQNESTLFTSNEENQANLHETPSTSTIHDDRSSIAPLPENQSPSMPSQDFSSLSMEETTNTADQIGPNTRLHGTSSTIHDNSSITPEFENASSQNSSTPSTEETSTSTSINTRPNVTLTEALSRSPLSQNEPTSGNRTWHTSPPTSTIHDSSSITPLSDNRSFSTSLQHSLNRTTEEPATIHSRPDVNLRSDEEALPRSSLKSETSKTTQESLKKSTPYKLEFDRSNNSIAKKSPAENNEHSKIQNKSTTKIPIDNFADIKPSTSATMNENIQGTNKKVLNDEEDNGLRENDQSDQILFTSIEEEFSYLDLLRSIEHENNRLKMEENYSNLVRHKQIINVPDMQKNRISVSNETRQANLNKFRESRKVAQEMDNESVNVPSTSNNKQALKKNAFIRPIVEVIPLVIYEEEKNRYQLFSHDYWPTFPKEGLKIVTLSGAHASGKTSLIHTIAYRLGYCLNDQQTVLTKFRTGVFMYIFKHDQLAILDCCDSLERLEDEEGSLAASSFLLELYCYLLSDHRIQHIPMSKTFYTTEYPQDEFQHCAKTMMALFDAGIKLERIGAIQVTLLLRYPDIINEGDEQFEEIRLRNELNRHDNVVKIVETLNELKDDPENEEIKSKFNNTFNDMIAIINPTKLLYLPKLNSAREREVYYDELDRLIDSIKKTPIHNAFVKNDKFPNKPTFEQLAYGIWNAIDNNKEVIDAAIKACNKIIASENDEFGIEEYFESIAENYGNLEGIRKAFVQIKKDSEEASQKKEGDGIFMFKGIAKVAEVLLMSTEGNEKERENKISWALCGLNLFFKKVSGGEQYALILIRVVIKETRILDYLFTEKIFLTFASCWTFFSFMAHYGFRLELIKYDIFNVSEKTMIRTKSEITTDPEAIKIQKIVFDTLTQLMNTDLFDIYRMNAPASEKDKKRIDEQELICLLYDFEVDSETQKFKDKLENGQNLIKVDNVEQIYDQLFELPKKFFENTSHSDRYEVKYEELDAPVLYEFTKVAMNIFYKAIGHYIAKNLCDSEKHFMLDDERPLEILSSMMSTWTAVAHIAGEFKEILKKLFETRIKEWHLNFRGDLKQPSITDVLKLENALIYAESVHNLKNVDQIMMINANEMIHSTVKETQAEKRKKLIDYYGHIRLSILNRPNTMTKLLKNYCEAYETISRFYDRHFKGENHKEVKEIEVWLFHLERLLIDGNEQEDRMLCLLVYFANRQKLIEKIKILCGIITNYLILNKTKLSRHEKRTVLLAIIAMALLLNKLIFYFHKIDTESNDFFGQDPRNTTPQMTKLWSNLTEIYKFLVDCIIQNSYDIALTEHIYEEALFMTLCFTYNLASISRIDYINVSSEYFKEKIVRHQNADDNIKLICSVNDFVKLDILDDKPNDEKIAKISDDDNNDLKKIHTAAYILVRYTNFRDEKIQTETMHGELYMLQDAFVHSIRVWLKDVKRNKILEARKNKLGVQANNEVKFILKGLDHIVPVKKHQQAFNDITIQEMRAPKAEPQLLIEEIVMLPIGHEKFEGIKLKLRKIDDEDEKFSVLKQALFEKYGIGEACALMILLYNDINPDTCKSINIIRQHFQHIVDHSTNISDKCLNLVTILERKDVEKSNDLLIQMLKPRFVKETMINFGYKVSDYKTKSGKDGMRLIADKDEILNRVNEIRRFLIMINEEELKNLSKANDNPKIEFRIDSSFSIVDGNCFEDRCLPSFFFYDVQYAGIWSRKPIKELRKSLNTIKMLFCVIRVRIEEKTYQAIFTTSQKLSYVKHKLRELRRVNGHNFEVYDFNKPDVKLNENDTLSVLNLKPAACLILKFE